MTVRPARGMALIEALVASAVLGIGLAGATRLTLHSLQTASETRQQGVAQVLGGHAMGCHQSGRLDCEFNSSVTVQGTTYTLQSQLSARSGLALEDIEVRVQWPIQRRSPISGAATASGGTAQIVLYSSRDQVPAWLGLFLP